MDQSYFRNVEVDDLLQIWEWCSRRLHVKWQRKRKLRNGCFIGLACALSHSEGGSNTPMELIKNYQTMPSPLLGKEGIRSFWEARPVSLLELCLGAYTKASPLTKRLNRLRLSYQNNSILDDLAKKMRCREKRFGDDWFTDGHHPEHQVRLLKKEMKPLCHQLEVFLSGEPETVNELALQVLAKGWQFGEVPASSRTRRAPERVLNKAQRLRLWQAAQEVLSRNLSEEDIIRVLWDTLHHKVSPALKAAIESQGYLVADVVGDLISFDLQKSRDEITAA